MQGTDYDVALTRVRQSWPAGRVPGLKRAAVLGGVGLLLAGGLAVKDYAAFGAGVGLMSGLILRASLREVGQLTSQQAVEQEQAALGEVLASMSNALQQTLADSGAEGVVKSLGDAGVPASLLSEPSAVVSRIEAL